MILGNQLEYLVLDGNAYHQSTIPIKWGELPLETFSLQNTDVTGDLSFVRVGATQGTALVDTLQDLWVQDNPGLSGPIPGEISLLQSLTSVKLAGNRLNGSLPPEIGTMFWLEELLLQNNHQLEGPVPAAYSQLPWLKGFRIEGNLVNGTMPDGLCQNRHPKGSLMTLGADCEAPVEINCSCCTCCGVAECVLFESLP